MYLIVIVIATISVLSVYAQAMNGQITHIAQKQTAFAEILINWHIKAVGVAVPLTSGPACALSPDDTTTIACTKQAVRQPYEFSSLLYKSTNGHSYVVTYILSAVQTLNGVNTGYTASDVYRQLGRTHFDSYSYGIVEVPGTLKIKQSIYDIPVVIPKGALVLVGFP